MARQKAFDLRDNTVENIVEKSLEQVLPESMLLYGEYVILDRALPRVEDGLKPVQRRILYTMHELKMFPDAAFKKSARVVGECLGKFHPHGDSSVYDAMVRMAQDFNMRMPLVKGHGNFGSMDGDPAAAMRYTEVKLEALATELLRDLDKDTVKWNKNFDDTLDEPDVLPGRFPNLLVNGAKGIAIGLATSIPTHNLTEVIDGCIALIDNPRLPLRELLKIIKGPDFPTGGFLLGGEDIYQVYETGKGKLVVRGKMDIENEGDRQNIIISEIPFTATKDAIQKKIYDLKEKKKDGYVNVTEVADESDRNGMRIVVRLKKGEDAVKLLNRLYKDTDLQSNFNVNMVAIAKGKPKQMGLIEILKYYLEFQKDVIYRRSRYEIGIAEKRAAILEGFLTVMPAIDEVIALIRAAATRAEAKVKLKERFELTDVQADAILSLQLGNINRLDVTKFENELKDLRGKLAKLRKIVGSTAEQYRVVRSELEEIRDRYKTKRLTTIIDSLDEVEVKAYDPTKRTAKRCVAAIDSEGRVKHLSTRNYVSANRDLESSGYDGLTVSLADVNPGAEALIIGNLGNCYKFSGDRIKECRWNDRGVALHDAYPGVAENEKAVCLLVPTEEEIEQADLYLYTKSGMVKKSSVKSCIVGKDAYQIIALKPDDEVIGCEIVRDNATILFVTSDGQCVNSLTDDYPRQGRIAGGVIGVNLNEGERVVFAGQAVVEPEFSPEEEKIVYYPVGEIVVINEKGLGKKVLAREFNPIGRNRKGVRIMDVYGQDTKVIFASTVLEPYFIGLVTQDKEVEILDTENLRLENKNTKGKPVLRGKTLVRAVRHKEEL
ncbi:MAG TPA: DNA topoisomerase 4 subunit A [Candidatus Stercoripulliclostridium merdipullorum]|uniref:DNA topoisomerase (ATP-hydrolyzing) n=1 Tax=Candidatus Stercoripulliclostridium merdipullorum TaxID=2840952 RepID=A0A9D1NBQ4_9FIRM|nr:DNA topoisomerase 4 subunit A [Candidatus Stercoripulliclostridium merdipullorum]